MTNLTKKLLWFFAGVLVLAYIAGSIFFTMNTFPKTKVNGIDKGLISKEKLYDSNSNSNELTIQGRDNKSFTVKPEEIKYVKVVAGKPDYNQNPLLWPIEVFKNHDYKVDYNYRYDEAKLEEIVKNSPVFSTQAEPVDAIVEYDDDNSDFVIIPEKKGSKIDYNTVKEPILKAIGEGTETLNLEDYYVKPKISSSDENLKKELEEIKKLISHEYIFDFEDREFKLTKKSLYDVYDLTEDGYVLNRKKLREFVANIAKQTDTYGTKRKFKATGLGEITVEPGIYGWQMNVDKTTDTLMAMIDEGKEGKVDISYRKDEYFSYTAMSRKKDDIGDTYLEADLSRQTLWYYEDGKLVVTSPFVSGQATIKNAATPVGVNKVRDKQSPKTLVGVNEINGGEYEVDVTYWINVGWTGSGFHDVSYRKRYGGDIYKTNGSSSCVNTPLEAMEILYEKVKLGTPVVIYESTTKYSPTEFEKQSINAKRAAEEKALKDKTKINDKKPKNDENNN